jgi:hypothetical protein
MVQRTVRELGDLPGELDAGRAATGGNSVCASFTASSSRSPAFAARSPAFASQSSPSSPGAEGVSDTSRTLAESAHCKQHDAYTDVP